MADPEFTTKTAFRVARTESGQRGPSWVGCLALATLCLLYPASDAAAASGDEIRRRPAPAVSPQDLARDPETGTYFMTTVLGGTILHLSSDLEELLATLPTPFASGEMLTGIAYDTHDGTLWVAQPQTREIAEIETDGTPTARRLAPAFIAPVNPLGQATPRGMAFFPGGSFGEGSLLVVESVGSQIYEISLDGQVIRSFDHPDDPDGFPGLGASAGTSDIFPILFNDGEEILGFYLTGLDRETGRQMLRRLDSSGRYTGYSIALQRAGGRVSGVLVQPFDCCEGEVRVDPAVIAVVETSAEIVVLDGREPPIPEIYGLSCAEVGDSIELAWTNVYSYERVEVIRDSRVVAILEGDANRHVDPALPEGVFTYEVRAVEGGEATTTGPCKAVIGPGRVLRHAEFDGELPVDLTVDTQDRILVSDFAERKILVYDDALLLVRDFPVRPFLEDDDRISGLAFRPETDTVLVYNPTTQHVAEVDLEGDPANRQPFFVDLPNDAEDPDDEASVTAMDYSPGGDDGRGSLWILENTRSVAYEASLEGRILRALLHPDVDRVDVPEGLTYLGPYTSGLCLVPGSDGQYLELTGGTVYDRDTVRILRVDTRTGRALGGLDIPLAGADRVRPHTSPAIVRSRNPATRLVWLATIRRRAPALMALDGSDPVLRPVTDLGCEQEGSTTAARLSFSGNDTYDRIEIDRDLERLAVLPGDAGSYLDTTAGPGVHRYDVRGARGSTTTGFISCHVRLGPGALLERRIVNVPSPDQLARDPRDGVLLVSSSTTTASRDLFRLAAGSSEPERLEALLEEPLRTVGVAVRASAASPPSIVILASERSTTLQGEQRFLLRTVEFETGIVTDAPLQPPRPANGFVTVPSGLTWDAESDTFFFLERNTATIVRIDPRGHVLASFPHPARPRQSSVFNLGLTALPDGAGLLATTAGPDDDRVTRIVHMTRRGRLTGIEIPVDTLALSTVRGIAVDGLDLLVAGTTGSIPLILGAELFDDVAAPGDFSCRRERGRILLSWSNLRVYDHLELYRNGQLLARIAGSAREFEDTDAPGESEVTTYALRGVVGDESGPPAVCETPGKAVESLFIRGDADYSLIVDITDPIIMLEVMFLGKGRLVCLDAADADDNGELEITDPIRTLEVLFLGTAQIPPPYPERGQDPSPDGLGCAAGSI